MIVHKFYTDGFYPNPHIAQAAGISIRELNSLEAQFLSILDFDVSVTGPEYKQLLGAVNEFFVTGPTE